MWLPGASSWPQDADWMDLSVIQQDSLFYLQHHPWWFWSRPFLLGPVEGGSWQTLQLWRPGNLDSHRCATHRSWLRGPRRWLALHLALDTAAASKVARWWDRDEADSKNRRLNTCSVCAHIFNVQYLYFAYL